MAAQVTVLNRLRHEVVLCADYVDATGKRVKNKVKYTVDGETREGREILLPRCPKGSFAPTPVTLAKSDWEKIARHKAVQGYLDKGQIEVR